MTIFDVNEIYKKYATSEDFLKEDVRYWAEIRKIADGIKADFSEKPILLLSGPSGSGKTTTAERIERFLDEQGYETHTVSLDCYFSSLSKEDAKKVDLESPERLDKDLLCEHIEKMLRCEEIELPEFDFVNTKQIKSGVKLRRKPNEIIIFEGIHALNPNAVCIDHGVNKMYISVRSRLSFADGKILHPKYLRLLRRISRDMRFRGRQPSDTLAFFESVERGVENFVMPYKIYADYSIDTFIEYEPLIYRDELLLKLEESRKTVRQEDRQTLELLIEFLSSYSGRDQSLVSEDSLIREFVPFKG